MTISSRMVSQTITDSTHISNSYGALMSNRWNTEARIGGSELDVPAINMKCASVTPTFG
jgi:hypothetical protein